MWTFLIGSLTKYLIIGGIILGVLGATWGHGYLKGRLSEVEAHYKKIDKLEKYYEKKIDKMQRTINRLRGRDEDDNGSWIPWREEDEEELKSLEKEALPILERLKEYRNSD